MLDLWFSEFHAPDAKLSILVKEQLYSEQTPFQKIDFFDSETFGKFFTLDGLIMITEKDEFIYHEMISNVPMAVNPDIKKVLIIGGGDGGTAREVCRFKTVEQVDWSKSMNVSYVCARNIFRRLLVRWIMIRGSI